MRISTVELETLRERITPQDTPERRAHYLRGDFPRSERVQDLDRRYRWDLLWASGGTGGLAQGLADAHIDTALRRIVPPLID